jgi:hypothetical protein
VQQDEETGDRRQEFRSCSMVRESLLSAMVTHPEPKIRFGESLALSPELLSPELLSPELLSPELLRFIVFQASFVLKLS